MKTETNLLPCGECTMCCRKEAIFLYPEDGDNPGLYKTRQVWHPLENRPVHVLEQRNGACVYLGDKGCTIYDKRPSTCRTYDCRRFVMKFTRAQEKKVIEEGKADPAMFKKGREMLKRYPV
jgi:uncharacterized protein